MPLNANQVLLKIYGPAKELLISKPFPSAEAATAWAVEYQKTGLSAATHRKLTFEVVGLTPRI